MAHPNGTSSLNRAKSLRAPASLGKPGQGAVSRGPPGSGVTTTATSHATASPAAPSNISLFLTNLRLLDVDLHPDWPDINTHTFSTRDAAQGQKKRIQSVEWALYHLFRLWDPDEARNKLKPFFPPLDQVQSLNLRAALLRGLEQAKKNGVLGRDAVVRKTMLDECKGERLEEVLAVFSSAVLKKMVAEQRLNGGGEGHTALAQTLALENRGYSGERAELTALVLAHRVSLRRALDEKNAARARFKEFSDLLESKEKALLNRKEEAAAAKRNGQRVAATEEQKREIWRALCNNWTGDERWMEALVYGDSKARKDGVLTAPYDRVWRRVQSGRLAELEDTSAGLLEQLDSRVQEQQQRLEKWQGFRLRMFGRTGPQPAAKEAEGQSKRKGIDLGFTAHENLHLGRMSPRKLHGIKPAQLDSHYEALVSGLKSDLERITPSASRVPSFFQKPPATERFPREPIKEAEAEAISDISDLEEAQPVLRPSPSRREPIRVSKEPAFEPVLRKAKTFDEEHVLPDGEPLTPSRLRRSATAQAQFTPPRRWPLPESPTRPQDREQNSAANPQSRRPTSPAHLPRSPPRRVSASPEPLPSPDLPPSPTQELADQILASVNAASPSPVKKPRHRLSLAERTRLSMARRTSHANIRVQAEDEDGFVDDDDPDEVDPLPLKRAPITVPVVAEPAAAAEQEDIDGYPEEAGYEDLTTRTRRSMAGFEAARQKAQMERRRSLRKGPSPSTPAAAGGKNGYFPAVDEEEGNNTTLLLAEELISKGGDDDYEAVFMSRPKLKNSPVGTPVREFWD